MWKIIVLTSLIIGVQPNLQKFLGKWIPVMVYPNVVYIPMCTKYSVYEDFDGQKICQCTCADNKNTTLVIMSLEENINYDRQEVDRRSFPLVEVFDSSEIMPALNVSCICGQERFRTRLVAKYINGEYFSLYELKNVSYYTKKEENTAYIMAKKIESSYAIRNIAKKLDDLKDRRGGIMCLIEVAENQYWRHLFLLLLV